MSLAHETILYIDFAKLKSNFQHLSQLKKETDVIAIISHAYGLGDIEIASFLEKLGWIYFWVAILRKVNLRS